MHGKLFLHLLSLTRQKGLDSLPWLDSQQILQMTQEILDQTSAFIPIGETLKKDLA